MGETDGSATAETDGGSPGDAEGWRYYAALAVSGLSMLAWLGGVVGLGYILYALVTDGPVLFAVGVTVAAVVIGALLAKIERRFYSLDL